MADNKISTIEIPVSEGFRLGFESKEPGHVWRLTNPDFGINVNMSDTQFTENGLTTAFTITANKPGQYLLHFACENPFNSQEKSSEAKYLITFKP